MTASIAVIAWSKWGAPVGSVVSNPIAIRPVSQQPQERGETTGGAVAVAKAAQIELSEPGAVVWGETLVEVIDTAAMAGADSSPRRGATRRIREIVPPHGKPAQTPAGLANALPLGGLLDIPRAQSGRLFPAIGQTGWVPPDPTLAVGPNHLVTTVNQSIAFYTKLGVQQFYNDLGSAGNPGFFETVGAGGFTFDPKCFYDHFAQRFVVVAPEVYGSTEAWITIAVSDDSNPNGTWYKYRTDAVITVGTQTFWWDYPGFGYDQDAYYVNSNLFGLNEGGWGGVGFRIFHKAPMLTGATAIYSTMRDGGSGSVQSAQHFGDPQTPYFVSLASGSALRIHAIRDPLTAPQFVIADVTVPSHTGPGEAPAAGGNTVSLVDARIFNAAWRGGNLYAAHNISAGGKNVARWYHLQTNDWPNSGAITFVQSGNIDPGGDKHTYFPAIYSNKYNEIGMVVGASSPSQRISVNVTGRKPGDPAGFMGALTQVKLGPVNGGGRWGDYYDIALDPVDRETFWVIGEHVESFGWQTWIGSFKVTEGDLPFAVPDEAGVIFGANSATIDVLANDYHTGDQPLTIESFDAVSLQGGTVARVVGGGEGGRDALSYTAPTGYTGLDSFSYTVADPNMQTAMTAVSADVYDTAAFRTPENPAIVAPGLDAAYYALSNPLDLPDFSTLTPSSEEVVSNLNYAASSGDFAGSGRMNNVGAVFTGYVSVPVDDFYTFYLNSDDGSELFLGTTLLIDNGNLHSMREYSASIGLKAGTHALRVEYFEFTGDAGLIVSIAGGGSAKQVIAASALSHATCAGDLDGDGDIDLTDLSSLLANYGVPSGAEYVDGDLNGDGDVDLEDLSSLLSGFGSICG